MHQNKYSEHAYFQAVRTIAEEAIQYTDEEERENWIHETIDGIDWVIYTHCAGKVIEFSDNRNAIFDVMSAVCADSWNGVFNQGAFYAMRADVYDALAHLS